MSTTLLAARESSCNNIMFEFGFAVSMSARYILRLNNSCRVRWAMRMHAMWVANAQEGRMKQQQRAESETEWVFHMIYVRDAVLCPPKMPHLLLRRTSNEFNQNLTLTKYSTIIFNDCT